MKHFFVSAMMLVGVFFAQPLLAQGINFQSITLKEAMSKAANKEQPKLILIDCFTTWCIPCIEMAQMEFPKKIAGDYFNPRFVSVKFDMEKGEGLEIGKKYNVKGYPTFLILNAEGKEINRIVGKSTAEEFIEKVKLALDPKNSLPSKKTTYQQQKNMITGLPYALALYQNAQDPAPVLEELFDNAHDFERFSKEYLELALSITKFGSPFFRKIMLEKQKMDLALGTENINRILFDKIRKDMYSIATETGAKYNVFYTPQQVEDVAYTIALLKMDPSKPEHHICRIALFVVNKDIDGLIQYYKRNISTLPSNDAFKGIVDGILLSKIAKVNPAQQKAIQAYFEDVAAYKEREAKQYRSNAETAQKAINK